LRFPILADIVAKMRLIQLKQQQAFLRKKVYRSYEEGLYTVVYGGHGASVVFGFLTLT
jgi:hypothetical protein